MSKTQLIRWSGLAAILGGLLLIPDALKVAPVAPWYGVLASSMLIYGLMGIYAYQAERCGVAGLLGFAFFVASAVYFAAGGETGDASFWIFASLNALGVVLLAFGTLAAGRFPRWVPWLWIAALLIGLTLTILPAFAQLSEPLGAVALALGMIGAGYTLWSRPS